MLVSIKENAVFRRLYHRGKTAGNRYLVIYCSRNRLGVNRFGFTVSTKLGHAVVRNRTRRRLREICRVHNPLLKEGYDIVVVARSAAVEAPFSCLTDAYLTLIEKLSLRRDAE